MKSYLASIIGGAALVAVFGSGVANALNEYNGMTYEKAAETIQNNGGTPVIVTREGSYLPTEKCVVVGSRNAGSNVRLDLNCNDTSALNGHPGNSVASPEGKRALQVRTTAKSLNEDYAASAAAGKQSYCEQNAASCSNFCQGPGVGLCSAELMQALGL